MQEVSYLIGTIVAIRVCALVLVLVRVCDGPSIMQDRAVDKLIYFHFILKNM